MLRFFAFKKPKEALLICPTLEISAQENLTNLLFFLLLEDLVVSSLSGVALSSLAQSFFPMISLCQLNSAQVDLMILSLLLISMGRASMRENWILFLGCMIYKCQKTPIGF
jgi:hypothetical protein